MEPFNARDDHICSRPQTDATHGLAGRQRERWPLCGQKRGRGAGVARPAPWPPMRMDATNTGSGQRGKEIAVDFFDYAVIILLELSAFADWVESESVHPIPPISKVL